MTLVLAQAYFITGLIWLICHSKEVVSIARKTRMPAFFVSLNAIVNTLFWPVALAWYNFKAISAERV